MQQPGQPRLTVDYGAAHTKAALVWPDGRWEPLPLADGPGVLSSAVHIDGRGTVLVGEAAWQHAPVEPDGFVPCPLACLDGPGGGTVTVPGRELPVADLAVATLRHIAAAAAARLGTPVEDVRMVVPAEWGPRRRTWLRQVAHAAGLGQPRLIEAPVAAATGVVAAGVPVPVGAFLLICDLGARCEATVLRRGPTGFEVLSTLADPHAGTTGIDDRLAGTLTGAADDPPAQMDSGRRWSIAATARAAREALSRQAVVTVSMPPPAPPTVLHAHVLNQVAEPVLTRAGELAAEAVTAAELTVEQLAGVYLIGGAAVMPAAARIIGDRLGVVPQAMAGPGFAAVLGAADADPAPSIGHGDAAAAAGSVEPVPPLRRLSGLLVPGLASLALYAHMVFTASVHNGTPDGRSRYYYVLATWGELTLAAVFALLACLAAAPLLGAALARAQQRDSPHAAADDMLVVRIAGGIGLAVAAGVAIAAIYAVGAGVYLGVPVSGPLRWALLPLLPTVAAGAGIAWLARRPVRPPGGWSAVLGFPVSSVLCTAVGMGLLAVWWQGPIPAVLAGWGTTLGRVGGMLVGAGIACALVRALAARVAVGVVLAFFGFLVVGAGGTGILAVGYALAVAACWAYRLWVLHRPSADVHAHRPAAATTTPPAHARG